MFNFMVSFLATISLLIGLVLVVSPLPIGLIVIALSLSVLICVNARVKSWVKRLRFRYHWINRKMHMVEKLLEYKFKKLWHAFVETRPNKTGKDNIDKE